MPGRNGFQLTDCSIQIHPEMKVPVASGHTENAIVHSGIIDSDLNLIGKLYSAHDLARKVRELSD
jgi:DNA-binding NarL/FixJ family response regulator